VAAYGTIASGGSYHEPVMVTRIEDRRGRVLEAFAPEAPQEALDEDVAYTLLDALRGVIDRGTGVSIRTRFGIRADVAGKTGTTQDNADGWFILMHPQLVAGAWVGFNDPRVTLRSDYWGQGAPAAAVVGTSCAAPGTRLIDARSRFVAPDDSGCRACLRVAGWFQAGSRCRPSRRRKRRRRRPGPEDAPISAGSDRPHRRGKQNEEAARQAAGGANTN
jgi:penicillin-binding protein 1A